MGSNFQGKPKSDDPLTKAAIEAVRRVTFQIDRSAGEREDLVRFLRSRTDRTLLTNPPRLMGAMVAPYAMEFSAGVRKRGTDYFWNQSEKE